MDPLIRVPTARLAQLELIDTEGVADTLQSHSECATRPQNMSAPVAHRTELRYERSRDTHPKPHDLRARPDALFDAGLLKGTFQVEPTGRKCFTSHDSRTHRHNCCS